MQEWDPYEHLMDLTRFCNSADEHVKSLLKNQKLIVEQINELNHELRELKSRLSVLEHIVMDAQNGD